MKISEVIKRFIIENPSSLSNSKKEVEIIREEEGYYWIISSGKYTKSDTFLTLEETENNMCTFLKNLTLIGSVYVHKECFG